MARNFKLKITRPVIVHGIGSSAPGDVVEVPINDAQELLLVDAAVIYTDEMAAEDETAAQAAAEADSKGGKKNKNPEGKK
jgi:hypothetical protein